MLFQYHNRARLIVTIHGIHFQVVGLRGVGVHKQQNNSRGYDNKSVGWRKGESEYQVVEAVADGGALVFLRGVREFLQEHFIHLRRI